MHHQVKQGNRLSYSNTNKFLKQLVNLMLVPPYNLIGWFFYVLYFYLYYMRTTLIIVFATVLFFSCKHSNNELKEQLVLADSVAINYFKGDGSMDTVVLVKMIKNKNTLNQLSSFIAEDITKEKINCGYDGSIHFFKTDMVIQDIYFRMNSDDCSQFTFSFKGVSSASQLSREAKKLLLQIKG